MKLLAFDTSTDLISIAVTRLVDGQARLWQHTGAGGAQASAALIPAIETLMAEAELKFEALDAIAFGRGPGSFTGLRIACGVTQGLAYALDVRVKGIVTLMALAEDLYRTDGCRQVIACIDARMGEVYHAAYEQRGGGWHEVHAPGLCKPDAVPELPAGTWAGCGSGFSVYRAALESCYAGKLARVIENLVPHAREIAVLAAAEFGRGGAVSAELAAPLYVRNKVALRMDER